MSDTAFPAHIVAALDHFHVPPLPDGFGDRLIMRIAAGDLPEEGWENRDPLPDLRRSVPGSGWRRSGRIAVVALACGLATATAAASGVFGDAVYVPVISDALAKADLVTMPPKKPERQSAATHGKAKVNGAANEAEETVAGKDIFLKKMQTLRKDPAYRALSPEQKIVRSRQEIKAMLDSGAVTVADIKAARRQLRDERQAKADAPLKQGPPVRDKVSPPLKPRSDGEQPGILTQYQKDKVRQAVAQLTPEQQAELRVLRQRRRNAAPDERRAIAEEIRFFWKRVGVKPPAQETEAGADDAGVSAKP